MIASRILVALIAGAGLALLSLLVTSYVGPRGVQVLAMLIFFGFTVNVLIAVPEHYGISSGLLATALFATAYERLPYRRSLLALLVFLAAATTITNAAFPAACLLYVQARRLRKEQLRVFLKAAVVGGAVLLVAAVAVLSQSGKFEKLREGDTIVTQFWSVRFLESPALAALLIPAAVAYPVIGPAPRLVGPEGNQGLSYEPVDFTGYGPVEAAGLAAWLALLALSARAAFLSGERRPLLALCAGWIAFNIAFHSVWGDEFFLYSPHWSFAIAAVFAMGVGEIALKWLFSLSALVIAGQVLSLYQVVAAVNSL